MVVVVAVVVAAAAAAVALMFKQARQSPRVPGPCWEAAVAAAEEEELAKERDSVDVDAAATPARLKLARHLSMAQKQSHQCQPH